MRQKRQATVLQRMYPETKARLEVLARAMGVDCAKCLDMLVVIPEEDYRAEDGDRAA